MVIMWHLHCKHYNNYSGGGCSIYANGKIARGCGASGCGYDREGSALANFINEYLQEELQLAFAKEFEFLNGQPFIHSRGHIWYKSISLSHSSIYGVRVIMKLSEYKRKPSIITKKVYMDGACGKSSVERLCEFIGYELQYLSGTKNTTDYLLKKKE